MMPIHILSLGAGVQSSTLALMAALGEVSPMPQAAIFADTQAEPRSVYEWLSWLTKQLPMNGKIKGVPFLHDSLKPLSEVDFSTDEDRGQQVLFANECEGMCGV
jgi:hypothetical protein